MIVRTVRTLMLHQPNFSYVGSGALLVELERIKFSIAGTDVILLCDGGVRVARFANGERVSEWIEEVA